jgi:hypothetical protein
VSNPENSGMNRISTRACSNFNDIRLKIIKAGKFILPVIHVLLSIILVIGKANNFQ